MSGIIVVADQPIPGPGVDVARVVHRVTLLGRRGGGALVAPAGPGGPLVVAGVRHHVVDVPPGLAPQPRAAAVADQVGPLLDRLRPDVAHVFGLPAAVPAVIRGRGGLRVVVEPGVTPAQWLRDHEPETPAARLSDLVSVEDKTLAHADAVVAHSAIEAATLVRRGVSTDRIWTVHDPLPAAPPPAAPSELPHVVLVSDLEPWSGWEVLLDALVRLKQPWRLTAVLPGDAHAGPILARARHLRIGERVHVAAGEVDVAARVAGAQVVVCPLLPTRAVVAGAVVPEAVLWALACGRPVAASDLPVVRAYAGAAARYFEPADAGALAAALSELLGDAELRAEVAARALEARARLASDRAEQTLSDLWSTLTEG